MSKSNEWKIILGIAVGLISLSDLQAAQNFSCYDLSTRNPNSLVLCEGQKWLNGKTVSSKPAASPSNSNRPKFKCQFSEFNWGMTLKEARGKLLLKGKIPQESFDQHLLPGIDLPAKVLAYEDTISDAPCSIKLGFSPESEKLAMVTINIPLENMASVETITNLLRQKYGPPYKRYSDGGTVWGGQQEDMLAYTPNFDFSSGEGSFLISYSSYEFRELFSQEVKQTKNQKLQKAASQL